MKYEPKVKAKQRNPYFNFLINPSFQGINRLFVLSFKVKNGRTSYTRYNPSLVKIKVYNVMINGRNIFDQPVKNDLIRYENIQKITTGQGDDYTTGCLLDYPYFNNYYKMVAIDLSRQGRLDADLKAIQEINFSTNLD